MFLNNAILYIIKMYPNLTLPFKTKRTRLVILLVDYIKMLRLYFEFADPDDVEIGKHISSVLREAICSDNIFSMEYILYELKFQLWITYYKQVALEYRGIDMCLPASLMLEL